MRNARNRKYGYVTEEYATAYDSTVWDECIVGTGVVSIASAKLKLNTPANNDIAALVTKHPYLLRNIRLSVSNVDVATSAPARAGIVLAKTKTTNANPETLNDSIRFCLNAVTSKFTVTTDVGGTEKVLYDAAWTDGDGQLQIDMEPDGFFSVYEDALPRIVGSNPLTATSTPEIFNLYVYQYTLGLAGTLGYGLFDNFRLDLDENPTADVSGRGVRLTSERNNTPVWGRLLDMTGTADTFETDAADYAATPVQRVILSRDVKRLELEEIRAYFDSANAATSGVALYEDAQADDVLSYSHMLWKSGDNASISDKTVFVKTTNDTPLPITFNLETLGQVWFVQDYSAAPGDTKGYLILKGKEVE